MDTPQPYQPENLRPESRDQLGRFAHGNPGKPVGARSKNRISRDALVAVQSLSSLAILKLRERIEAGDMQAIRLTLEFTLPRGGRTIELDTANPNAWADAMAEGDISPTEAATAAQALVKLNEAGETAELAKRLEELESLITEQRSGR